jgi:hypothetical protein
MAQTVVLVVYTSKVFSICALRTYAVAVRADNLAHVFETDARAYFSATVSNPNLKSGQACAVLGLSMTITTRALRVLSACQAPVSSGSGRLVLTFTAALCSLTVQIAYVHIPE